MDAFELSQNCINHVDLLGDYNNLCLEISDSVVLPDHYKYARTSGILNSRNNTKDAVIREEINNNVLFNKDLIDVKKNSKTSIFNNSPEDEDELCEEVPIE